MRLNLTKVEKGFVGGDVMYHAFVKKVRFDWDPIEVQHLLQTNPFTHATLLLAAPLFTLPLKDP